MIIYSRFNILNLDSIIIESRLNNLYDLPIEIVSLTVMIIIITVNETISSSSSSSTM